MNLTKIVFLLLFAIAVGACSNSGSDSSDGGNGDNSKNNVPPGSLGMNCASFDGAQLVATAPLMYVPSIGGSKITSVQLQMYLQGFGTTTTFSIPMTLNAYACVTPGEALPSLAAQAAVNPGLNGSAKAVTFTFASPMPIPQSCAAGQVAVVFQLVDGSGFATHLYAQSTAVSGSCALAMSSSGTQVVEGNGRVYEAVITATP